MAAPSLVSGFAGLVFLLFSGGGLTHLPLGIPPGPDDPAMARVAPAECLFYVSWAGTARPSAESANRTERLLADAEIRRLGRELKSRFQAAVRQGAGDGERSRAVADTLPRLLETLATRPTAFFVEPPGQASGSVPRMGLLVNVGDRSDEIEKKLDTFARIVSRGEVTTETENGTTWHRLHFLRWAFVEGYLVAGIGDGTTQRMLERMHAERVPGWLTTLRKRLAAERTANMAYLNVRHLVASLAPRLERTDPQLLPILDKLGLKNIDSMAATTGLDDQGCVSRTWIHTDGAPVGIPAWLGGEPLAASDVSPIPADATIVLALRLDAEKTLDRLVALVNDIEPGAGEEIRRALVQLGTELNVSIRDDVLTPLGGTWTLYHSPSEGGTLFTGWTAVVPLRDPQKLQKTSQTLAGQARRANEELRELVGRRPRFAGLQQYEFQGHTVHFVNVVGNDDVPFAPAWCVTDEELVVSLFPQGVNAYLSRGRQGQTLADVPAVAARLDEAEPPVLLAYYDSEALVKAAYPLVLMVGNMVCAELQQEGVDVNIALLPSLPALTRYLEPGTTAVYSRDDGIEVVSRRTLPVGLGAAQVLLPVAAAEFFPRSVSLLGTDLLDAVSPARARRRVSTNNLKQIGLAMHNFHDAHKRLPEAVSRDKEGRPLLSWRVRLLPFLDEAALFEEFHHDEPWDSPHNKKLIARMPDVFRAPGSKAGEGKTTYLTLRGKETVFPSQGSSRFADIRDGTSNTIMVVEATDDQAVVWTRPADLPFDPQQPRRGLIGADRTGILALFADGAIHFLAGSLEDETLRRLANPRDGKPVGNFR